MPDPHTNIDDPEIAGTFPNGANDEAFRSNPEEDDPMYHSEQNTGTASGTGTGASAMDELIEVTRELKNNLARLVGAGRNIANEQIHRARDGAGNLLQRGKDRASSVAGSTGEYVREEPMKSLIIAAGAGLVLGYLMHRPRD